MELLISHLVISGHLVCFVFPLLELILGEHAEFRFVHEFIEVLKKRSDSAEINICSVLLEDSAKHEFSRNGI